MRHEVEAQLDELRRFVRCLRMADKRPFERLYAAVKARMSAITYANPLNPGELMQWSVLIELEKRIKKLEDDTGRRVH